MMSQVSMKPSSKRRENAVEESESTLGFESRNVLYIFILTFK